MVPVGGQYFILESYLALRLDNLIERFFLRSHLAKRVPPFFTFLQKNF